MDLLTGILYLTLNVYHEARSEDQFAQMAVAHVTMNRSRERGISIKDVVMQPRQFSWTHQKKSYLPNDIDAFMQCLQSVSIAARGKDFTKGATYYHLDGTTPYWASSYNYVGSFGAHRFYN
jgi:N-acetylmuramoyl-L-alanine amidase